MRSLGGKIYQSLKRKRFKMDLQKVRQALIQNDFIIFASDYGKKVVAESWTKR